MRSVNKCLYTSRGIKDVEYIISGTVLSNTIKERDLGLTISADMKVSEQCGIAASKGNLFIFINQAKYRVQGKGTNHTAVQNNS